MSYVPPRSAELAVRALLDGRDVDEVSRIVHNLIGEVATLAARVDAWREALSASIPEEPRDE